MTSLSTKWPKTETRQIRRFSLKNVFGDLTGHTNIQQSHTNLYGYLFLRCLNNNIIILDGQIDTIIKKKILADNLL